MDTPLSQTPRLRWVLVDGNLCNVSDFSAVPMPQRPPAYCPICERPVTLKLGQKRVHHFAHRPEDECSATQPETAIHLNCKFHIYRQLQQAKVVLTTVSCSGCGKEKPILWKRNWDDVAVEYKLGSMRPDIALLRNGQVIGAIEVFVTHAVDEEKARRLQSQGVDWIEVYGHEGLYEEPNAWTTDQPLDTIRQHPNPPEWVCPECQKNEQREQYLRDHPTLIYCAKMVDFYYASGKKYRRVFYVKQAFSYGEKTRIWVEDEDRHVLATENEPITKESHQRLNAAFARKFQEMVQKAQKVDDPMNWVMWKPGQKFYVMDLDNFPFRYAWNESKRKWVMQPNVKWKKLG